MKHHYFLQSAQNSLLFFSVFLLVEKEKQSFYTLLFDSVLLDKQQKVSYPYDFCDFAESCGILEKYREL